MKIPFKHFVLELTDPKNTLETAVLMLHGFPSESYNGTEREKNQDLLRHICTSKRCNGYLHHYNGLGKNSEGNFSFIESINDSIELTKKLLDKYKNLILIGHSWGGFVAMNCFKEFHEKIPQMILLSPFNTIPDMNLLKQALTEITSDHVHILKSRNVDFFINEFTFIEKKFNPFSFIPNISFTGDILLLQAEKDSEVPPATTSRLATTFKNEVYYKSIDTDHSFTNHRDQLFTLCESFLR